MTETDRRRSDPGRAARARGARRSAPATSAGRSGLFERDTSLWSSRSATSRRRSPSGSAGSTRRPTSTPRSARSRRFGEAIRDAGLHDGAIVAGMGGSSLAPEVLAEDVRRRRATGSSCASSTRPTRRPSAATVDDLDPLATLFIVATQVGHDDRAAGLPGRRLGPDRGRAQGPPPHDLSPGDFMIAITDPGRSLDAIPHHDELREVFLNPPDIGGRYSALTYVGLVPASLIGLDLDPLLGSARAMLDRCHAKRPAGQPRAWPRARARHARRRPAATS